MVSVLQLLAPRTECGGNIIMLEMDECLEVFFLKKGTIGAGFSINKIRHIGIKWVD